MIKITKAMREFVHNKLQFSQAYQNKQTAYLKDFRKEVFKIKSFISDSRDKEKFHYISINLSKNVVDTYTDTIIGDDIEVDFGDLQEDWDNIKDHVMQKIITPIQKQSMMGYGVVRIRKKEPGYRIEVVPIMNYFPMIEDGYLGEEITDVKVHHIVSLKNEDKDIYANVDSYYIVGERWYSTHGKYRLNLAVDAWIFNDSNRVGEEIVMPPYDMDTRPLFVLNNDNINDEYVDDGKIDSNLIDNPVLGESDLIDCLDIIADINDRQTQLAIEFIQHMKSKMSLPESIVQAISAVIEENKKDGKDYGNVGIKSYDYYTHKEGEQPAQYIQKNNGHIDLALKNIEQLIKQLSRVTRIPTSILGLDEKGGDEKVGVIHKRFEPFYKRIEKKRRAIKHTLQRMFTLIMFYETDKRYDCKISFDQLKKPDPKEQVELYSMLLDRQVVSPVTVLQEALGYTEEQAQEEMVRVRESQSIVSNINGDQFLPQLT